MHFRVNNSSLTYIKPVFQITCCRIFDTVDGGFSDWDEWGPCTAECGGGDQTRSRRCDSPPPQFGGVDCVGELFECQQCNMEPCSSHCPV